MIDGVVYSSNWHIYRLAKFHTRNGHFLEIYKIDKYRENPGSPPHIKAGPCTHIQFRADRMDCVMPQLSLFHTKHGPHGLQDPQDLK